MATNPVCRSLTAAVMLAAASLCPLSLQAETLAEQELEALATADESLALAPVTDREDAFIPASKQEIIASLSVPEQAPVPTRTVLPEYPAFAQQSRLQGVVYARVLVDSSGQVTQVGRIRGHAVFHEAVRAAASRWHFDPARQGQLPVQTWVTVPFAFVL